MNELRIRGYIIMTGFSFVILIFIIRLFYLQVLSPEYRQKAEVKDIVEIELIPARGIIFDRDSMMYVKNTPVYDIMFIPKEIRIPDTSIITKYLGLTAEQIRTEINKYKGLERYQWHPLKKQLDNSTFNPFSEQMYQFSGISVTARPTREYNYACGASFLGYINEVSPRDLEKAKKADDAFYKSGDLTGISGVERKYENFLRGKKGKKTILQDAYRREVGPYADGALDELPVQGMDLILGIDTELQMLGELLMKNKKGSIVAIEPSTGEILAFVSAPSYDPGLLAGPNLGINYLNLERDTLLLPLYNRPLQAQYPPGSIFKMVQALAGLSLNVINENTHYPCSGRWFRNGGKPSCHGAHGSCSLHSAIVHSCNAYFAETYYNIMNNKRDIHESYQIWRDVMDAYGLGRKLGVDIPNENSGNVPSVKFYNKSYPHGWSGLTIYSNSIGQGEILMTPMQMANIAAIIANRGYYITPHFTSAYRDTTGLWKKIIFAKNFVPGEKAHFEIVVNGMEDVVKIGTGTMARLDSFIVCGKTGTVENPPYPDHSVFIAFAPKENPKIAVAVIVENAGWGGSWAAPISSLMLEQYLTDSISTKSQSKLQRILDFKLTPESAISAEAAH